MKKIVIILILIISQATWAQDFIIGEVKEVKNGNTFVVQYDNKKQIVQIKDSNILEKEKAQLYLKENILDKEVILAEVSNENNVLLTDAVMYNCKRSADESDDFPCIEANNLNIEMFSQGFLEYTGDIEFLQMTNK